MPSRLGALSAPPTFASASSVAAPPGALVRSGPAPVVDGFERSAEAHPFFEVDPSRRDAGFRRYVAAGLDVLRNNPSSVAQDTYRAIVTGRVKIDSFTDMTRGDFEHLRKELAGDLGLDAKAYGRLAERKVQRAITAGIYGYMWDDRLYVDRGLSPRRLARILVHEVNHIVNASEEHYRGALNVLREEYRARYAERLLDGPPPDARECLRLKAGVISDYELTGVSPEDVADLPPGRLEFAWPTA